MPIKTFLLFLPFLLMALSFKKMTPLEYSAKECEKVSSILCKKYGFVQIGSGGSAPCGIINYESFEFQTIGYCNISEARKILLECAEVYLNAMNSCEKIRHAMVKYPFDGENCHMGIYFCNSDKSEVLHPYLSYACIFDGRLFYRSYKDLNNRSNTKVEFVETYQEALERAKES